MNLQIFDFWNEQKKNTEAVSQYPYFQVGQIWWAQIGKNVATEVDGKGVHFLRPVIIFQRVYGNASLVIPLTSKMRQGNYYFSFHDSKKKKQCALLTQIRYIDGKRLRYQKGYIQKKDFENLRKALFSLIKK